MGSERRRLLHGEYQPEDQEDLDEIVLVTIQLIF